MSPTHYQPPARPLALPVTGQALREALRHNDTDALNRLVRQLRIAGIQIDGQTLATQMLTHGCLWVEDAFGQRISLQMQVPALVTQPDVEAKPDFCLSA